MTIRVLFGLGLCAVFELLSLIVPAQLLPLEQAAGRISAGYLWAYPPGIPLILPGERVYEAFLQGCRALTACGVVLHSGERDGTLRVLPE